MRRLKKTMCGITTLIADEGYRGELIETAITVFNYILKIVMKQRRPKMHLSLYPCDG